MSEEINIDIEVLISLVEAQPVLWDKTEEIYKDRNATKKAWLEVFIGLKEDFEKLGEDEQNLFGKEVIRRWTNVRDAFAKSCKKQRETNTSNGGTAKCKKYVYNDQLKFLLKLYYGKENEDSFDKNEKNHRKGTDDSTANPKTLKKSSDESAANFQSQRTELSSRKRRKPMDELELKMLKALEGDNPNRHLSFFQGIIPSLEEFDDDDIVQFQIEVLQLISNLNRLKRKKISTQVPTSLQAHSLSSYENQQSQQLNQGISSIQLSATSQLAALSTPVCNTCKNSSQALLTSSNNTKDSESHNFPSINTNIVQAKSLDLNSMKAQRESSKDETFSISKELFEKFTAFSKKNLKYLKLVIGYQNRKYTEKSWSSRV